MKRANTKEMKKYAKEIFRNANLVQQLGVGSSCATGIPSLCDFSEDVQEAYNQAVNQQMFLKNLRRAVKDEVLEELAAKEVSTTKLVKYYFIFTEAELNSLFSKYTVLVSNIKRLIIIDQIEKLLINTVQTEDEDREVAKAVNRIHKCLL